MELLALKWKDERDVDMLSTVHTTITVPTSKKHHRTEANHDVMWIT